VVQIDSLRLDAVETIARAAAFYDTLPARAATEAALLREHDARLVISDAPPLGCAAAAVAGIPSIVISNFTWDWIYAAYGAELTAAPGLVPLLGETYAQSAGGWRLPMYGGFETITPLLDLPFVARHARHPRDEVRALCGLAQDARVALLSFGGYGVNDLELERLDCRQDWVVLLTHDGTYEGPVPAGVALLSEPALYGAGLRYEDLVAAVDVVMTKPGYGIISECVGNDTALLYTPRGRFAEYDVMVREMPRFLRCAIIGHADLFDGRWLAALEAVTAQPPPPERPATNGADVVARMILDLVELRRDGDKEISNRR
jgi:L-arabinokinase